VTSYQHQFRAMASSFSIRIDIWTDAQTQETDQSIQRLMKTLEQETVRLELVMSRFNADSELMQLMQSIGTPQRVSPNLYAVLKLAQQLVHWTHGAFDPRILTDLERIGYRGASRTPTPMPDMMDRHIVSFLETRDVPTVALKSPIDLGGIGKGYTADWLADTIEQALDPMLVAGYIVDAGGDIVLAGCQDSYEPWSVGIENPLAPDSLCAVLSLRPTHAPRFAICTSSLWRKSWSYDGRSVHHLINPQTGQPAETPLYSVTALGEQAAVTEIVTKYVFLRGFESAELWRHCAPQCLWVTRDGDLGMTEEMRPFVTWTSMKITN